MKRSWIVLGIGLVGAGAAAVASIESVKAQDAEPEPKALVDTYEVMEFFFEPTFETMKEAMAKEPESRKEWKAIYDGAYTLAEATNLLFFRDDDYSKEDGWHGMAAQARDDAESIAKSVMQQDYQAAREAWTATVKSCNACHDKYEPDGPDTFEAF